jgi:hypothetical protein
LIRKEGYHKYSPTYISELSDCDMDMWWQACATLFPNLASHPIIMFTDECAVLYLSARSRNVYVHAKQNPHLFQEVAQHPLHVVMWVGITSELIMTGESYLELLSHWLIPELDNSGLPNKRRTIPLCC